MSSKICLLFSQILHQGNFPLNFVFLSSSLSRSRVYELDTRGKLIKITNALCFILRRFAGLQSSNDGISCRRISLVPYFIKISSQILRDYYFYVKGGKEL